MKDKQTVWIIINTDNVDGLVVFMLSGNIIRGGIVLAVYPGLCVFYEYHPIFSHHCSH